MPIARFFLVPTPATHHCGQAYFLQRALRSRRRNVSVIRKHNTRALRLEPKGDAHDSTDRISFDKYFKTIFNVRTLEIWNVPGPLYKAKYEGAPHCGQASIYFISFQFIKHNKNNFFFGNIFYVVLNIQYFSLHVLFYTIN